MLRLAARIPAGLRDTAGGPDGRGAGLAAGAVPRASGRRDVR